MWTKNSGNLSLEDIKFEPRKYVDKKCNQLK